MTVDRYKGHASRDRHRVRMKEVLRDACANFEAEMVEFNGEGDHVHLLGPFPPNAALANLVIAVKDV